MEKVKKQYLTNELTGAALFMSLACVVLLTLIAGARIDQVIVLEYPSGSQECLQRSDGHDSLDNSVRSHKVAEDFYPLHYGLFFNQKSDSNSSFINPESLVCSRIGISEQIQRSPPSPAC